MSPPVPAPAPAHPQPALGTATLGESGREPYWAAPPERRASVADPGSARWCRACGAVSTGPGSSCAACGWSFEPAGAPQSWVGMVFALPGKLLVNKRRGICIAADQHAVELHFSAVDSQVIPLTNLPSFDEGWSRTDLSPSARLQHAARQVQHGEIKATWDAAVLFEVAGAWANLSVAAMRQLADEAITMGWPEVLDWVGLTPSEKSWRRAHAAASTGDASALAGHLAELPPSGYPDRLRLCLPFLSDVLREPDRWKRVVAAGTALQLEGAATLASVVAGANRTALQDLGRLLSERGHMQRGQYWVDAADRLDGGVPGAPPDQPQQAWRALAYLFNEADDPEVDEMPPVLSQLTPSLFDDLIEADRLTADHNLGDVAGPNRSYVQARLTPQVLSEDELRSLGHHGELARRHFVTGTLDELSRLPAHPVVGHYQQLANVALGQPAETVKLRKRTRRALTAIVRARADLESATINSLPDELMEDPSLWMLVSAYAQSGALVATDEQRRNHGVYVNWLDLNRLCGLVTEGLNEDAVELGLCLLETIDEPGAKAEASSLTAAALHRAARTEEAFVLVEEAMSIHKAEGLWVNAAILARRVRPERAAYYDAQLAMFLGSPEARATALRFAIDSSGRAGEESWRSDLIEAAKVVLADCDFDTYAMVLSKARTAASRLVLELPARGGRFDQPRFLYTKIAQTFASGDPSANDIIDAFNGVAEEHRDDAWFMQELQSQADGQIGVMSEASLCAYRIGLVSISFAGSMQRWLRPEQVYMLGCLGTTRTEYELIANERWLSDTAYDEWFFDPIEQFLASGNNLAPDVACQVREAFSKSLHRAMMRHLGITRELSVVIWRNFRNEVRTNRRGREKLVTELPELREDTLVRIRLGERAAEALRSLGSLTVEQQRRIGEIEELALAYRRDTIDSLQEL